MSALVERMRAQRERWVDVGGYGFLLRRPTALQMAVWRRSGADERTLLAEAVVGWRGVRERDLVSSGGETEIPFEADTCIEWLSDRPDLLDGVLDALHGMIVEHGDRLETARKK